MSYLAALVILLLTLTAQIAGDCSVYDTLQSSSTDRCRQVQDCVNEAFSINENNLYYLDKVFRSTQSHTPVALIINYHVIVPQNIITDHKVNDDDLGVSDSGSGSGSADESNWMTTKAEVDTRPFETANYTEQIGWSTTGIYKAIRPEVLVALQPAWYWRTIGRAIDNYSFPRTLHLALNGTSSKKCNQLAGITRSEMREALEHLTMNLNYNTTGQTAYIWNTDTNSLQLEEYVLFAAIVILGIFLLVLLTAFLPRVHHAYSEKYKSSWDSNSVEYLISFILIVEIFYHFLFLLHFSKLDLYTNIRVKLQYVVISAIMSGMIYGFAVGCYYRKCSCRGIIRIVDNFGSIYMLVICFAAYSLPVLIEAFIYPTEVISTIGFIMIAIAIISAGSAHTTLNQNTRSDSNSKSTCTMAKCWQRLQMVLLCVCLYFIIPAAVYVLLLFYLSLLKLLLESPTSQLFQLILTLVPVTVGICSLVIEKKLGSQKKQNQQKEKIDSEFNSDNSDDESNSAQERRKHKRGYRKLVNEEDDQPQNSINTPEQRQPEGKQLRKRAQVATQVHVRQQIPQESSSQEMRVHIIEVEPNQDNTDTTTENESTM